MAFTSKKKKKTGKHHKGLKITDTTLRDGHQSILATRMRTEDMLPVIEDMDDVGFHSLEVWGGATFDVTTRFLGEDPWERLSAIKEKCKQTPLMMLLRGQNLVGYRNYADDVVRSFVHMAAQTGIDIFRVFDALNDERNFLTAFDAIKKEDKHIQGTICYSQTEGHLGGDIFHLKYYIKKARTLEKMGADSICIKDMAGLMLPYDTYEIIKAIKENVSLPVQLHTHYTAGLGSMTYLKAVEAGVDVIDCAFAPFALRTGQPAVEPIVAALQGQKRDTGLDVHVLEKIGKHFEKIAPKYRDFLDTTRLSVIDIGVLIHQTPGGMLSNLINQLREADALDKLDKVFEEIPKTRKDLGFPPLVTPTSQIVGVQAVQNVLFGRYKMITSQVKDYCYGLYGSPPLPISKRIQAMALKGYERGSKPIKKRPGDVLKPEMEEAKAATEGLAKNLGDELIYALYPTTGLRFLKWKYSIEEMPEEVKPVSIEKAKEREKLVEKARAGEVVEKHPETAPDRGPGTKSFNVFVGGDYYEVEVEEQPSPTGIARNISVAGGPATAPNQAAVKMENGHSSSPRLSKPANNIPTAPTPVADADEITISAPMPGMIIRFDVKKGQKIKAGDVIVVIEAMKMQNALPSPIDGTIKNISVKVGTSVLKNDVLAIIKK